MKTHKVEIKPPFIKLDSLLKFTGLSETGGDAKLVIAEGRIKVNGEICTARGKKIYPGDKVEIPELSITLDIGEKG
ncbi:MAG: RNA-binding S4 domain-containing protein [Ruminococcus sp.]|nr:RNA-binding S4 domain-containing protein [Ruminococcus sp.]